ncbi:MAG: hypothetical protein EPN84_08010 [Legionella sp.]|nr:MAG: hypothetical protein EPN84_08010 [Legionella sp.]
MSPFQKDFIATVLKKLNEILSNPHEINTTVSSFTRNSNDSRYKGTSCMSNPELWTPNNAQYFKAAVFEAIARATVIIKNKGYCFEDEFLKEIHQATTLFKDTVSLRITQISSTDNPLEQVRTNIVAIQSDYAEENPYPFFSYVAAGVAIAAGAAAIYLKK